MQNGIWSWFFGNKIRFSLFLVVVAILFYLLIKSGNTNSVRVEHGSGQQSTAMEQELENRNIIMQVVQATEEIERHPDPAYLRNAVGRLDSWLVKQPSVKSFSLDSEFEQFSKLSADLSEHFRLADTQYLKFIKSQKSELTVQDGEKLIAELETILLKLGEVKKIHSFPIFDVFNKVIADSIKRLKDSSSYQFGDRVGLFQTAVQKLEFPTWFRLGRAAQNFDTLRVLMKSDIRAFNPEDADFLMQSVWLRNISSWAKGEKQDDLQIALHLFDWTVCNVALMKAGITGPTGPVPQLPWETLLTGMGSVADRATIFMELLRQNRIDSFILQPAQEVPPAFPIIVGVCINNEIFLFLPEFGLPIPGKDGLKLDKGLTFTSVATLSQVMTDDSLLRKLDLSDKEKVALTSANFKEMTAYLPTNPFILSERMALMESEFGNPNDKTDSEESENQAGSSAYTVLYLLYPQLKEKAMGMKGVTGVKHYWTGYNALVEHVFLSFETRLLVGPYYYSMKEGASIDPQIKENKADQYRDTKSEAEDIGMSDGSGNNADISPKQKESNVKNPPLWIGKVLYFKGKFTNERGAAHWLQQGQTSDRQLKQMANELDQRTLAFVEKAHEDSAKAGKALTPQELRELSVQFREKVLTEISVRRYIKTTSRYCLGLLSLEAGNLDTAVNHLTDPVIRNDLNGLWLPPAVYLLGRTYEVKGDYDRSAAVLKTVDVPMKYGSQLRAKWINELNGKKAAPAPVKQDAAPVAAPAPVKKDTAPVAASAPVKKDAAPAAAPAPVKQDTAPVAAPAPVKKDTAPVAAPAPVKKEVAPVAAPAPVKKDTAPAPVKKDAASGK